MLVDAHRRVAGVSGPGRPAEAGRRLAHAYVLQLVADFQSFARELHDLAAMTLVRLSHADAGYWAELTTAITDDRLLDRGNADVHALQRDFRRLGIGALNDKLGRWNARWPDDRGRVRALIDLRNAIAHGNQRQIDRLRGAGVPDTRTWAAGQRPALNRLARALDRVTWDHLHHTSHQEPW